MTPQYRTSPLIASPHGFFGRHGGVSAGDFEGLNGSFHSGDAHEPVAENRRRMSLAMGAEAIVTAHQTHSARALFVEQPFAYDQRPEADALITRTPGLAVAVLAADCVPVLFEAEDIVGAAHAGWRGSLGGILESTIALMEEHGADRAGIKAAIGPHLRRDRFEVRDDLIAAVLSVHPSAERHFAATGKGQALFDHTGFIRDRLREAGIADDRCDDVGGNTLSSQNLWFSYRGAQKAGQVKFGHNLSAISPKRCHSCVD